MNDGSRYNLLERSYSGNETDLVRLQHRINDKNYIDLDNILDENKDREKFKILISERSLKSNAEVFTKSMLQNEGKIPRIDSELLVQKAEFFFDLLVRRFNLTPIFVYLKTDPMKCYQRLVYRNRKEESKVSRAYLEKLHQSYEVFYRSLGHRSIEVDLESFSLGATSLSFIDVDRIVNYIRLRL